VPGADAARVHPPELPRRLEGVEDLLPIPFCDSISAFFWSSVQRELPPSMTMSPSPSRSLSELMVSRVIWPAGTITQTILGEGSFWTMSSRLSASLSSGLRS
jgi:hypothetical protein